MREKHIVLRAASLEQLYLREEAFFRMSAGWKYVLKRYFLPERDSEGIIPGTGAVSYIVQPPLDGCGVAVWIYMVSGADVEYSQGETVVSCDGLAFIWTAGLNAEGVDSAEQTARMLENYEARLASDGLSITDDCVRTWFFVHEIDDNYAGLVKARRENFTRCGLTQSTHYIASTGIGGSPVDRRFVVQMDALAIKGLRQSQQRYLYAPTHLNPTYEYGVTFERGVRIGFDDRVYSIISGTASIDNKGEVLHEGDVVKQTYRMWENVSELLKESGASLDDVLQMLVYLRNPEDYEKVAPLFADKFPDVPYIFLLAPVCRPTWLIEMECVAVHQPK